MASVIESPLELYYFSSFAKVASLIALEHSGLPYLYKKPEDWMTMKANLEWGCLPCLKNVPEEHSASREVGQEIAILNYIAARVPGKMKGIDIREEIISQKLYGVGEDIYQALGRIKNKSVTKDMAIRFWAKENQDSNVNNRQFGIYVYLDMLEKFIQNCKLANSGKFTLSGCTIGECKVWASLHAVHLIDATAIDGYSGVKNFYTRFLEEDATQTVLKGDKTGGILQQYFEKPEGT